jgi:hypothetical protein
MVDNMICFVVFKKGSVQSLSLVKEVHALDTIIRGLLGFRNEFPPEELSVEVLSSRYIVDWDLEPAYLTKSFLIAGQLKHSTNTGLSIIPE